MIKQLHKFIDKRFQFKIKHLVIDGLFRGLGYADGQWGLQFSLCVVCGVKLSNTMNLIIHPKRTKCMGKGDFIKLRSASRLLFDMLQLPDYNPKIFYSRYNIIEMAE